MNRRTIRAAAMMLSLAIVLAAPPRACAQLIGGRAARLSRMPEHRGNKDSSIRYDPALMAPGTSRDRVHTAFGTPNATQGDGAAREDVYAFHPDGAKFIEPQMNAGTIAAAVFTGGMSLAVRRARTAVQESQLTLYHVHYDAADKVKSVNAVPPGSGSPNPSPPAR
jgi:hypothetical protein